LGHNARLWLHAEVTIGVPGSHAATKEPELGSMPRACVRPRGTVLCVGKRPHSPAQWLLNFHINKFDLLGRQQLPSKDDRPGYLLGSRNAGTTLGSNKKPRRCRNLSARSHLACSSVNYSPLPHTLNNGKKCPNTRKKIKQPRKKIGQHDERSPLSGGHTLSLVLRAEQSRSQLPSRPTHKA